MRLTVTEEDIKNGVKLNGSSCALALAFEREIKPKNGDRISVGLHTAYVLRKNPALYNFEQTICTYDLPQEASLFITQFDASYKVSPTTFDVARRAGGDEACPE